MQLDIKYMVVGLAVNNMYYDIRGRRVIVHSNCMFVDPFHIDAVAVIEIWIVTRITRDITKA